MGKIYVRGIRRDTPFDVQSWDRHKMRFHGRNRVETRAVMGHWTGAENTVSAMYRNMSQALNVYGAPAPLSVHFAVDQLGTIHQLADTEMRGAHCKGHGANHWAIGIEFVGRGTAYAKVPDKGVQRPRVTERIHGAEVTYDELLSPQIEAGVALVEWLCGVYKLPVCVPEKTGSLVCADELTDAELETFRGFLGHLHCEPNKSDPGLRLLRAVQARGRLRTPAS